MELAVNLFSPNKDQLVPAPYTFPNDYEVPDCNLCGSDLTWRRCLISNAKGTRMNLVECTKCGFRFFSPRPKWSVLGPLVADENQQAQTLFDNCSFFKVDDVEAQKTAIRSYYNKMLEDVRDIIGHIPQTMFEVGGNVGWFAVAARDFGVPLIDGCDLNPFAVGLAQQGHGLAGYEAGDFADYQPKRQYELTVGLDYLEHTYTPKQDIEKLYGMTQPGGVFLFKTFLDERDFKHEQLSPPSHAIHWTEVVLRREIERVGFNIRTWRYDYGDYFVITIAQKPA